MIVEELSEVHQQLDEYLTKGWIKPSIPPYKAPILIFHKKEGTVRMCINPRMLNNQMKIDAYTIPLIEEI